MNIALWVVQILLALAFLGSGILKVTQPREKLAANMKWVGSFSPQIVKLIGALEVLGALGLILPAVTGVWTWLTPLAAVGLALTMIGAALTHVRLAEMSRIAPSIVLLALAVFVAYGRYFVTPL
ncbi:MAG: DoxX family protein [Chloroflexota bacterium]|nr:DoxX family protein [Chloroflexota bacterium]